MQTQTLNFRRSCLRAQRTAPVQSRRALVARCGPYQGEFTKPAELSNSAHRDFAAWRGTMDEELPSPAILQLMAHEFHTHGRSPQVGTDSLGSDVVVQSPAEASPSGRNVGWVGQMEGPAPMSAFLHPFTQVEEHPAHLEFRFKQAYNAYCAEIAKPDTELDLLTCASLIAQAVKYPYLEVQSVVSEIDALASEVKAALPAASTPDQVLATVIETLFQRHGFHGNQGLFTSEGHSFINSVLLDRTGLPITLALVFSEVSRRVGLPMLGLNLPTHFLLKPDVAGMEVLVDPFEGEVLKIESAEDHEAELLGTAVKLDPSWARPHVGVSPRRFVLRMLSNLKQIYMMTSDVDAARRVIKLMRATDPDNVDDLRDEGMVLYTGEWYSQALEDFEAYLKAAPDAEDCGMVRVMADSCRTLVHEAQQQEGSW